MALNITEASANSSLMNPMTPNSSVNQMAQQVGWGKWLTGGAKDQQASWAMSELGRKFTRAEAEKQRIFNSAEALKQRQYGERLSNTQYQRAVADMRKAGLNPALFYARQGGGANVPSSAPASSSAVSSGVGQMSPTSQIINVLGTIASSVLSSALKRPTQIFKMGN